DHLVAAAADELGTDALGDGALEVEHGRVVGELRDPDDADVRRQEVATPGQRVAAGRRDKAGNAGQASGQQVPACRPRATSRAGHRASFTTTLTSRPFATITFTTSLPSVCALTFASARAASRMAASSASAGTVTRPRTLPLTWTGSVSASAFAASSSSAGQPAATTPS